MYQNLIAYSTNMFKHPSIKKKTDTRKQKARGWGKLKYLKNKGKNSEIHNRAPDRALKIHTSKRDEGHGEEIYRDSWAKLRETHEL